jgi:hypothetical protein
MVQLKYLLIFLSVCNYSFSQKSGDFFKGHNCQYLHLVNDSLIKYYLDFSYWGALRTYAQGICGYSLNDSILILSIRENTLNNKIPSDSICSEISKIDSKDYQFKIIKQSDKGIYLIGPILKDHQKLNRKRFMKGFLNWPWKWSFRKQHWYDPIWRELKLTGANRIDGSSSIS